jgi:hypothetical protein
MTIVVDVPVGNSSSAVLGLIQTATAELGVSVPTYAVGNTATDTVQQLALINAVGNELQRQYTWQHAATEYRLTTQFLTTNGMTTTGSAVVTGISDTTGMDATFAVIGTGINADVYIRTVDSATQVTLTQAATASGSVSLSFCKVRYAYPADFDRPVDRTQWDKSKHWEMLGPQTPQQWGFLKSGFISTGPRLRFRPMGGYFQIWPAVASNEYIGFEYISTSWVMAAGDFSPSKGAFTLDTDTCAFPDRLMILGLKLKYFESKGFDTTAIARDFSMQLDIAKANDSGSAALSLAPRPSSYLIGVDQLPDSGYGR